MEQGLEYFIASVCAVWTVLIGYIFLISKYKRNDKDI